MSSRGIAELVDSQHSNVYATAERLVNSDMIGGYTALQYTHPQNEQTYHRYEVNKRDSYVIVVQLSPEFTARLVDRWQGLESNGGMTVPRSLPGALRLVADLAEQRQRLSEKLAVATPKTEFVDHYATTVRSMTFRQVVKLFNVKESEFAMFLVENGIMYQLNCVLTPKSEHIEAGRFEVKTGTVNQTNYAFNQSRFTAKGARWIDGL